MLWTDIITAVTKDGAALSGVDVRAWLVERGYSVPSRDDVEVTTGDDVVLRTKAEVRALLQLLECRPIEITREAKEPGPVRSAARGPEVDNRNDIGLKVEFVDAASDKAIGGVVLAHGTTLRIKVRIVPAPAGLPLKLELAFLGAKLRSRPAIRSVIGHTSGYRYLSRVRVARNEDGIRDPVSDLVKSAAVKDIAARDALAPKAVVDELTLLGLEAFHGLEELQACIFNTEGRLLSTALLTIMIDQGCRLGALRLIDCKTGEDFATGKDDEFDEIYAVAPAKTGGDVRVGVCDSGIFDDSGGKNYLQARIVGGKFFGTPEPESVQSPRLDREDCPTATGGEGSRHILFDSPSGHGTNVAGNAAWGTPKIKLVDVMVQKGQEAGAIAASTAARAFAWADQQGICVMNCSKVMPYSKDETNEAVAAAADRVLFLATGGNEGYSFPLGNTTFGPSGAMTVNDFPRSFVNTLWVGGCMKARTPHAKRGSGPAIDVLVPSDWLEVYTPAELMVVWRAQDLQYFAQDLLRFLHNELTVLPDRIAPLAKRARYDYLSKAEAAGKLDLSQHEDEELSQIRSMMTPNPLRVALSQAHSTIQSWPTDDMKAWYERLLQHKSERTTKPIVGEKIGTWLGNPSGVKTKTAYGDLIRAEKELKEKTDHGTPPPDIGSDDGVSFGLPIVANIAAKLKLIRSDLTPNKMKRLLIDTSDLDPGFESKCMANGMVNPLRAYLTAFDNDVAEGGRDPHQYVPATAVEDPRRVFYTFFYMGEDGLRLYNAIKGPMKEVYKEVNIDLVEAEPPLAIPFEDLTYVAGRAIGGHNWQSLVPMKHPLMHAPRHLRLILVNESALAFGNPFTGEGLVHSIKLDSMKRWKLTPGDDRATLTEASVMGNEWRCSLALDAPKIFARNGEHVLPVVKVDGMPVSEDRREHSRTPRTLSVTIRFATPELAADVKEVELEPGIVQPIGGNRLERNIFVNNRYHGGPGGTGAANKSALVLFLHEIGHALGMVPTSHPHHYDSTYGGEGEHCGINTQTESNEDAVRKYGMIGDGKSGSVKVPVQVVHQNMRAHDDFAPCVMFHTRTSMHYRSLFCKACKDVLKGSSLEGGWRWTRDA